MQRLPEQEAVKTTIVGGRPPGCGKAIGKIPRGFEVLIKKASVDAEFEKILLEKRAQASEEIQLTLEPAEAMMLNSVPESQLKLIIKNTKVEPRHRSAFLGKVATFMLIALGASTLSCSENQATSKGIRPDKIEKEVTQPEKKIPKKPEKCGGIRPDRPDVEPSSPVSKGIRSDRIKHLSRGIRPDRIRPTKEKVTPAEKKRIKQMENIDGRYYACKF